MYTHILIATDGSDLAAKGVEQGLAMAAPLGAQVTVLTVTEPMGYRALQAAAEAGVPNPLSAYDQSVAHEVEARFAPIRHAASARGVAAGFAHETDASPAEAIVRTARDQGCDLIVMASHGRRGVGRLILGSQTQEVLAHTTIPVLVIR